MKEREGCLHLHIPWLDDWMDGWIDGQTSNTYSKYTTFSTTPKQRD